MNSKRGTRINAIWVGLVLAGAALAVVSGFMTERSSPPRDAQPRASDHDEPPGGADPIQRVFVPSAPRGRSLKIDVSYDDGTAGRGVSARSLIDPLNGVG